MKGDYVKKWIALIILCIVMVGCRGKDGQDGAGGGEMQSFSGVTNGDETPGSSPQAQIAALETSGTIPKWERGSDLAGTDANRNQVRDDIEA